MKYIDADKLTKSINNYRQDAKGALNPIDGYADYYKGKIGACKDIQDFIDSLRQEQQEVDLEKEVNNYLKIRHLHIKDGGRVDASCDEGGFTAREGENFGGHSANGVNLVQNFVRDTFSCVFVVEFGHEFGGQADGCQGALEVMDDGGEHLPDGSEPDFSQAISNTSSPKRSARKIAREGQVFVETENNTFDLRGQEVK